MSFGAGAGTQGAIKYALIVDDAQATQKLNTFKTNLTSLATPTANLNRNLAQVGTTLKSTSTSVTQMGTSLKSAGVGLSQTTTQVNQLGSAQKNFNTITQTTGKNVATMGNNFKATVTQIKSAGPPLANFEKTSTSLTSKLKGNISQFSGLATGMSATASGALQLAAGFRDYSDAQIAVDRVTRKNSLAQEALGKAQAKLDALQKSGKASAAELAAARLDVAQADSMAKIQVQLLGEAQERMFDSQSQFIASVIPTTLGAIGSLGAAFSSLGGSMTKLKGIGPAVIGAMTSIAGAFTTTGAAAEGATVGVNGLKASLLTVGGPLAILVAGAVGVYEGTKTMYEAIRILDKGITSHAGNVSALEMLYGRLRIALGQASEEEKKAFYQMEADQDKIVKGLDKVEIPPWERIFGLSPETQKRLADVAALIDGELNPAIKDTGKAADATTPSIEKQALAVDELVKKNQLMFDSAKEEGQAQLDLKAKMEGTTMAILDVDRAVVQTGKNLEAKFSPAAQDVTKSWKAFNETLNVTTLSTGSLLTNTINGIVDSTLNLSKQGVDAVKVATAQNAVELDLNETLLAQAKTLGFTQLEMQDYTAGATDSTSAITGLNNELINQILLETKHQNTLNVTTRAYQFYNLGVNEAVAAAGEFVTGMIKSEGAASNFRAEVIRLRPELLNNLPKGIQLTDEQFKSLTSTFDDAGLRAEALSRVFNTVFSESRQALQELVDAATEGGDKWKDAWKDIKKTIPKSLRNDFKEFIEDQGEMGESLDEIIPKLDFYRQKWDDLSKGEKKSAVKDMADSLGDLRDQLDDITDIDIDEKIFDPLLKLKEGGLTKAELNTWEQFFNLYDTLAAEGGGIDDADVQILEDFVANNGDMDKLADATKNYLDQAKPVTEEQQKWIDNKKIKASIDAISGAFELQGTYVTALTGDYNLQGRAVRGLTKDFNQLVLIMQKMQDLKGGGNGNGFQTVEYQSKGVPGSDEPIPFNESRADEDKETTTPTMDFSTMESNAKAAFTNIRKQFDLMIGRFASGSAAWQSQWSSDMNTMAKNTASGGKQSGKQFDLMIGKFTSASSAFAHQWSSDMNAFAKNTKSGTTQSTKAFDKMIGKAADGFSALASHWSSMMNSMINNAKSAAKGVNSALGGIKDEDVFVRIHRVNVAQHGYHGTVSGPTMFLAGEAGEERVDITPNRTEPHTTVEGGGGTAAGGRGHIVVNLTNVLADREIIRTYRRKLGEDMYRFGPS